MLEFVCLQSKNLQHWSWVQDLRSTLKTYKLLLTLFFSKNQVEDHNSMTAMSQQIPISMDHLFQILGLHLPKKSHHLLQKSPMTALLDQLRLHVLVEHHMGNLQLLWLHILLLHHQAYLQVPYAWLHLERQAWAEEQQASDCTEATWHCLCE